MELSLAEEEDVEEEFDDEEIEELVRLANILRNKV